MSISAERLATTIQRIIPDIIQSKNKDEKIGYINITEVRVTKDHSYATIFYTILNDSQEALELVNSFFGRFKGQIKKDLAAKIKDTRKIPELIFKYDESLKQGNKIDEILKKLEK